MDVVLRVTLLGSLAAQNLSRPNTLPVLHFRTRKTATLFAFLAFHSGTPQPREELIERLWPEADLEAGRMSLRTALSSLRKDFGETLYADRTIITLYARTDVQFFEEVLHGLPTTTLVGPAQAEHLREAVEVYRGPLLPGFYDDWILQERYRLSAAYQRALTALTHWYETQNELHLALAYAHLSAVADPLSEHVRIDLIRLLKQTGRLDEARRQFDDMERLLAEQLGTTPTPALSALFPEIDRRGGGKKSSSTVRLPIPQSRLRGTQFLTLLRPARIGQTRLIIEAVRRLVAHGIVDEIWFVPLVTATTEEQIWDGIMQTLELTCAPSIPVIVSVILFYLSLELSYEGLAAGDEREIDLPP